MSTPADHRAEALAALALIQAADNPVAEMASASEATAHALLAVERRLGELVDPLGDESAATYVRERIGDIVNPDPETEAP